MRILALWLVAGIALAQTTRYPGAIDSDNSLFVVQDNVQTTLTAPMSISDTVAVVSSGTGFAPNMVATICDTTTNTGKCTAWEHMMVTAVTGNVLTVTRGFAGTSPRTHSSGRLISVLIDSMHQKVLKDSVIAIETALGPNLANIAPSPVTSSATYNFAAYSCNSTPICSPGGASGMSLIVGNNSLTMTPVPLGVNGTNTNHSLYVSGGTGLAEACRITGGSGIAGQASGQIIINCSNTHTGAWTIRSASSGVREALTVAGAGGTVYVPPGTSTVYAPVTIDQPNVSLLGTGFGSVLKAADNAAITTQVLQIFASGVTVRDLTIDGNRVNNGQTYTPGSITAGIFMQGSNLLISHVQVQNSAYLGIASYMSASMDNITVEDCFLHDNGGNTGPNQNGSGLWMEGGAGGLMRSNVTIARNRFDHNVPLQSPAGIGSCMVVEAIGLTVANNTCTRGAVNPSPGGAIMSIGAYDTFASGADFTFCGNLMNATFTGNVIDLTGTEGLMSGLEVCGKNVAITGNSIIGFINTGLSLEGATNSVTVTGNVLYSTGTDTTAIVMFANPFTLSQIPHHITISANTVTATTGIRIGSSGTNENNLSITGNNLTATTNPILSTTYAPADKWIILANLGFPKALSDSPIPVGASPFTYTTGYTYEFVRVLGGTVSTVGFSDGSPACVTLPSCLIYLPPNTPITVTYTAAPVMFSVIL